jgi:hypothetical protein
MQKAIQKKDAYDRTEPYAESFMLSVCITREDKDETSPGFLRRVSLILSTNGPVLRVAA